MNSIAHFNFDESEKPDLKYFTVRDGTHWCDVRAYGISHTIGPFSELPECETAAQKQIKLNLKMARVKAARGDMEVKLW